MTAFISLRTALNGGLMLVPVNRIRIVAAIIDAEAWCEGSDVPSTAKAFVQAEAAGNGCVFALWVRESVDEIAEKIAAAQSRVSPPVTPGRSAFDRY